LLSCQFPSQRQAESIRLKSICLHMWIHMVWA
jgi:hypothetical protein